MTTEIHGADMDTYNMIHEQGFGMVNLGRHLGLFYSSKENIHKCPPSWLFVATEDDLTVDQLRNLANEYKEETVKHF